MQDHVWISLALACLFCQAFCDVKNGCASRKIEIADKKLLLRLKRDNITGPETLTANSTDECVQLCCEKNGRCNLVEFHRTMKMNNCIHTYCYPISKCLEDDLDKRNGATATYQLVLSDGGGTGQRLINESVKQPKTSQIASRSIKSRKGVGETEATTNESFREKQKDSRTEASIAAKLLTPTKEPESTMTNPMTTAQPLDLGNTTVSSSTVMDGTVEATLIEDSTSITDYPDLDADKMKHVVPRKGALDGHLWIPFSTPASMLQPMDQQPRPPIPTKQIAPSDDRPSMQGRNATEFGANSDKEPSIRANLTSPTSNHHKNLPKDYDNSSTTTGLVEEFSLEAVQNKHDPKSFKRIILQTSSNVSSKLPPVKLVVSGSIDFLSSRTTVVAAQNLDELHFQQSIYLIVSLIIGFLVLLLVVGMVLKHVYGVWERRHYQRMDFLIDGLYNSRSAI